LTLELCVRELPHEDDPRTLLLSDERLAQTLETALRQASRLRNLGPLFRAAAHDLKTPLNAIALNLDLLREALPPPSPDNPKLERQRRNLSLMSAEIERLKGMLTKLTAQVTSSDADAAPFDLSQMITDLGQTLTPLAIRHRADLVTQVDGPPILFHGQRDALQQALLNIALNGLEAMPSGGRLTLRLHRVDARAVISITDTGVGIDESLQTEIFDLNYSTKPAGSGGGIGLYVAQQIVRQHRGVILVTSRVGQGSTFDVLLPLAVPTLRPM
jgi:signal transduction histidine kinase